MKINNVEVDFSITNLKHAEAMELALQKMGKTEERIKKEDARMKVSKVMGDMIQMFRDFFVDATGSDVLEKCEDFMDARKAYTEFLEEIKKQKAAALAPYELPVE